MKVLFETELQQQLVGPQAPQVRHRVEERLEALDREVSTALRAGVSRQAFQTAKALAEAIGAAKKTIDEAVPKQ